MAAVGSFYELSLANLVIDLGKNHLAQHAMLPFQPADRQGKQDDQGNVRHHVYVTSKEIAARRLDLLGYTMPAARAAFNGGLQSLDEWEQAQWPPELRADNGFEAWLAGMKTGLDATRGLQAAATNGGCPKFMFNRDELNSPRAHMFGFPHGDPPLVLRAALSVAVPGDPLVLDFDDLVEGGYVKDDGSLWKLSREPVIVVTEGKSDSRLLGKSLEVLFPELREFVSFIDFETANAKGGTDELLQFVRMVVGCGIKNRLLVLFDNDTAGVDALKRLTDKTLPKNVFAMTLPSIFLAKNYPTLGPEGEGWADVNEKACALELYLGKDSLEVEGMLSPIRWTGFNERLGRYQGQVANKRAIQEHFETKLHAVKSDPRAVTQYDFSGVREIFDSIVRVVSAG